MLAVVLVLWLGDDVLDTVIRATIVEVIEATTVVGEEGLALLVVGVSVDEASELLMGGGLDVVLTGSLEADEAGVLLAWVLVEAAPSVPEGELYSLMYP